MKLAEGGTERSIIEEDDVVECVFESFVVGPDFGHRRLPEIQSDRTRWDWAESYLAFVVENDSGYMLIRA